MYQRTVVRLIGSSKSSCQSIRLASTAVAHHHNKKSSTPLIEHYRSSWPDINPDKPAAKVLDLPNRTVPDHALNFSFSASFSNGSAFFYPHMKTNPADNKVVMTVRSSSIYIMATFIYYMHLLISCPHSPTFIDKLHFLFATPSQVMLSDLSLTAIQQRIFTRMVGKRMKVGNGELKLVSTMFQDRMENKKYLILQLERLLEEARRLSELPAETMFEPRSVKAKANVV